MTSQTKHCQATPSWTIFVPTDFGEVHNGDSWQAHAGSRIVYVSSMKVANGETRTDDLEALAAHAQDVNVVTV